MVYLLCWRLRGPCVHTPMASAMCVLHGPCKLTLLVFMWPVRTYSTGARVYLLWRCLRGPCILPPVASVWPVRTYFGDVCVARAYLHGDVCVAHAYLLRWRPRTYFGGVCVARAYIFRWHLHGPCVLTRT